MDDSESEAGVADATYQVYREHRWRGLDSLQAEGHEVRLAVVENNRLILLDEEHGRRLLRIGENLRYVPCSTKDSEPKSISRHRKRKRTTAASTSDRLEPLLGELNANMVLMSKLMMRQWMKSSQSNIKEILEKENTPETSQAVTNMVVAAQVHEQPSKRALQCSNSPDEKQNERNFPNATSEGKKREFVVSPETIEAISKFSQKHLDIIEYKGRTTVSPNTFDNNDEYFRILLHKLNPVVEVTRSKFVDNIIKNSTRADMTTAQELLLERFAATLGLVGLENQQFVSNILEERRQAEKANSKIYCELSDDVSTDSSEASNLQIKPADTNLRIKPADTQIKQAAKRRNTHPRKSSKRIKSGPQDKFITSPSSNESSDDTFKISHTKVSGVRINPANTQIKQASKRMNTPPRKSPKRIKTGPLDKLITSSSSNESSDDMPKISRTKVLSVRINPVNSQIKQAAKRKNTPPKNPRKRIKSGLKDDTISLSSSSVSSEDLFKRSTNKKANQKFKREANVKVHIKNTTEVDKVQKLSTSKSTTDVIEKSKHNRELRSTKVDNSYTSNTPSNENSPSSPARSQLKRPDLERVVEEDVDRVVSKQTHMKRLGEASPPKSPPMQKNKVDSSQNKSNKLNSTGNSSYVKNRVYSMIEDKIIIDYIINERIERLVKGNLIWQKLQKLYYSLSNQSRTWQSLKNRYLKYILPNLKYYGLGYEKEKRLRTGEYIGELKKKKPAKENSIFKVQPVSSASNVLRVRDKLKGISSSQNGEPKHSASNRDVTTKTAHNTESTKAGPSFSKAEAVLASSTPNNKPMVSIPTYSQLTRKFLKRRQAHSVSSGDSEPSKEIRSPTRAGTRKLFNAKV